MTVVNMSYLNMITTVMKKFYYREKELSIINRFIESDLKKALAIYGRRRTGKTELVLKALEGLNNAYYFQINSFDYDVSLTDFKNIVKIGKEDSILDSLSTFKDVFTYINKDKKIIIIDEFLLS